MTSHLRLSLILAALALVGCDQFYADQRVYRCTKHVIPAVARDRLCQSMPNCVIERNNLWRVLEAQREYNSLRCEEFER